MARDSRDAQVPSIHSLQQDEKLSTLLKQDRGADCMPCRIIGWLVLAISNDMPLTLRCLGASAFIGLGTYSYFSGRYQLRRQEAAILKSGSMFGMRTRQTGISGIAAVLIGMGLWRLIN